MSLRVSLLLASVLLFPPTFPNLCSDIRAGEERIAATDEDQELPIPVSSEMELPPPLPKPEVVSASYARSVIDPESKRFGLSSPSAKAWVGTKLSSDQPRILSIVSDSPAAVAGLAKGDVFDSVNYRHVNRTSEVVNRLKQYKPGDVVDIIIVRSNVRRLHRLTLGHPPAR